MHIDQPTLSSWPLLDLWKSDLIIDLIAQPDLLKPFRELIAFLVSCWDVRGCV